MAIKMREIRGMKEEALEKRLAELRTEKITGESQSTKINSVKLSIARVLTYLSQLRAKSPQAHPHKLSGKHPVASGAKVVGEGKPLNTKRA